jgi:hypothetical protein
VSPSSTGEDFDVATAVVGAAGLNQFDVNLHPAWTVLDKPNGGYLVAVLIRCAERVVQEVAPSHAICVSAATSYSGVPEIGPAKVSIAVHRSGKSVTNVRATLDQSGRSLVETAMIFGALGATSTRLYDDLRAPAVAEFSDCTSLSPPGGAESAMGILRGTDIVMDPATMDWSHGLDGVAELRGWARFADGRSADATSLHYFLDCFPPATFPLGSSGWVPTLQLTSYVRAIPGAGPLKIRQRAQVIDGGYVDEVCDIWDSSDVLVAQATQLALVRF